MVAALSITENENVQWIECILFVCLFVKLVDYFFFCLFVFCFAFFGGVLFRIVYFLLSLYLFFVFCLFLLISWFFFFFFAFFFFFSLQTRQVTSFSHHSTNSDRKVALTGRLACHDTWPWDISLHLSKPFSLNLVFRHWIFPLCGLRNLYVVTKKELVYATNSQWFHSLAPFLFFAFFFFCFLLFCIF